MTQPRHLPSLTALLLIAGLALVACGGGSTSAASPGSGATAAPGATDAPAATNGGVATEAPAASVAGGGINIGVATSALNDLDNYRFRMSMAAEGAAKFSLVPSGGSMTIEGSVIFRPARAADITMTTVGGPTDGTMAIRIIEDMAYVNLDGSDEWMASPDDGEQSTVDSFKPETFLGSYASMTGLQKVGDEDKNGIASEHYRSTEDVGYAGSFGLPDGKWTMDVWIAREGGYVVATQAIAEASGGADNGKFTMTVDVLAANDPSMKVEVPENVTQTGG